MCPFVVQLPLVLYTNGRVCVCVCVCVCTCVVRRDKYPASTPEDLLGYLSGCAVCAKSAQLCLTLCDLMDHRPPGSSVHGILQARILEWVAVPSSRGSSPPRDQTRISYCLLHWQAGSFPQVPPGKPSCQGTGP